MIDSIKDLERLLKLCRKQGVTKIRFDNVELELGELPREVTGTVQAEEDPYAGFPSGELTPEQLIFYSAGGLPENDPALKREAG